MKEEIIDKFKAKRVNCLSRSADDVYGNGWRNVGDTISVSIDGAFDQYIDF
jgi:hypothetical protein